MSSRDRVEAVVATMLLSCAAAALVWGIGVSVSGDAVARDISDPDFMVEPIDWLVDARWVVVALALLVAAAAGLMFRSLARRGAPATPTVVWSVVGIGAVCGGAYAVVTAPVVGANIGGGMIVMALPVVVVALAVVAVRAARHR